MGILLNTACSLMLEHKKRPFAGSILVLGKQDVYLSLNNLQFAAKQMGIELKALNPEEIEISKKPWCSNFKYITDTAFFKALGFTTVKSMDCSDYEGADYIWDMNNVVPEEYHERFDVIFDEGTCEHIFHIPNFLTSICLILKKGGRVIHDTPTAGLIDHGFYNISPTLYYDFYKANDFEINKISLFKQASHLVVSHMFEEIEYHPGDFDLHKCYLPDNKLYCTFCIATKVKDFQNCKVPQQSIWSRIAAKGVKNE